METRLHLLESFNARGDDGCVYSVRGYEHLARLDGTPDLAGEWQPTGLSEYRLATGEPLAVDRTGAMTIVSRDVKLRREGAAEG